MRYARVRNLGTVASFQRRARYFIYRPGLAGCLALSLLGLRVSPSWVPPCRGPETDRGEIGRMPISAKGGTAGRVSPGDGALFPVKPTGKSPCGGRGGGGSDQWGCGDKGPLAEARGRKAGVRRWPLPRCWRGRMPPSDGPMLSFRPRRRAIGIRRVDVGSQICARYLRRGISPPGRRSSCRPVGRRSRRPGVRGGFGDPRLIGDMPPVRANNELSGVVGE